MKRLILPFLISLIPAIAKGLDFQDGGGGGTAPTSPATVTNLTVNGNTTIGSDGADTFDLNVTSAAVDSAFGLNISTTTDGTGTSILMLDGANRRVGVNDTTPDAALDVGGTFQTDGNVTLGDASGDSVTSNAGTWTLANDVAVTVSGGANGLNIDANTLVVDASGDEVGIGVSDPTAKLQINNETGTTYDRELQIRNGSWGSGFVGLSSNLLSIGTDMTSLAIYTGSNMGVTGTSIPTNERMKIDSSGITFANDTAITLSGGVDGLNFDANTLSIDATGDFVGFGIAAPLAKIHALGADNSTVIISSINALQASVTTSDLFVAFNSNTGLEGSIAGTGVGGVIAYNTFTAGHWTQVVGFQPEILAPLCSNGKITDGLNKEQLVKSVRCGPQDPSILGFFAGQDAPGEKATALALGTGFAWVSNTGESVSIGDWLVTTGDGLTLKRQADDLQHNYSAAKASQPIIWKKGETKRKIAVTYHAG